MRIVLIAPGTRGDVEPYLALGKALADAGNIVRLVTHENFASFVVSHGVDFWAIPGDPRAVAQSGDMRALIESGNLLAILAKMAREAERSTLALTEGGLAACRDADLLIAGIGGIFIAAALAAKLDLPLLQAYYIPFTPTSAFPSFMAPPLPVQVGFLNRLSYTLARQTMWQTFRKGDRRARREVLNIDPAPLFGPFHSHAVRDTPVLYGYSPSVIPRPDDWGPDIHVTGYWFLDEAGDWTPPSDLAAFLEAGPPPIYIGFGSMSSRDPVQTANLIVEAVALAGQRAVVLGGWAELNRDGQVRERVPDTVYMLDAAPFAWLFPRMAAVVHHGGAGTTAAGLRAGVPSIVVPFFGDQPFWGRTVARLGVGPTPIPRRRLTARRLAQAITVAATDAPTRERAAALGARIRGEDGLANAVAVIQHYRERLREHR